MSQYPSTEGRLSSLERQSTRTNAHIEDITSALEDLKAQMNQGFEQAHAYIEEHIASKEDLKQLETRVAAIESNMATKDDIQTLRTEMSAMEERLVGVLKQFLQRPEA